MVRTHLTVGKRYHNSYMDRDFEIISIDRKTDVCIWKWVDDDEEKSGSYKQKKLLIEQTIEKKLPGFEQNLGSTDWLILMREISETTEPHGQADRILEELKREHFSSGEKKPREWRADQKLLDEQIYATTKMDTLSENAWIHITQIKTRGTIFQKFYLSLMDTFGYSVSTNTNGDYDGMVDSGNGPRRKEVKMASISNGKLNFFQIRQFQDWHDLVFVAVFPDRVELYEITKEKFIEYIKNNPGEQNWPGGGKKREDIDNDITQNDLFHWTREYPFPQEFTRIDQGTNEERPFEAKPEVVLNGAFESVFGDK